MSFWIPEPPPEPIATLPMVASKSESNRALILQALSQGAYRLHNVSAARDSVILQSLLASEEETLNAQDAGTTLRFITAWCCAAGRSARITGTARMQKRPIGLLAEALKELGADLEYENEEGFPPLKITGFEQKAQRISIAGDVSSQYISALLLIAPFLEQGLELEIDGELASRPYVQMTTGLMKQLGLQVEEDADLFRVQPQEAQAAEFTVESDWSAAGYWYSVLALRGAGELTLLNLREDSLQGDRALVDLFESLGVISRFTEQGLVLRPGPRAERFEADFTHIPDQAQTLAVCCAGLGIPATLSGLKSLRIKETDRIAALETELGKLGARITVEGDEVMHIDATPLQLRGQEIACYDDHRMAMSFAPLAALGPLKLDDPGVVAKSYPSFWEDWNLICS